MERELVLAIRGGTVQEAFEKHILPPFEKKYNAKVTLSVDTSVAALAKVDAQRNNPQTDIIQNTDQTHPQAKLRGLAEKLDAAKIPNLASVMKPALDRDGVGVVFGTYTFGAQYTPEIYKEKGIPAPVSWNDLFEPRVRGHMAVNSIDNVFGMMLLIGLARANGGDERNVEPAFAKLKSLGKDILIAKAPANLDEFFQQKEAWVATNGWNRYQTLKDKKFPITWVDPKEGPIGAVNYFDVVKGAPHPNLAQAFIDYMLTAEAQILMARYTGWAPVLRDIKVPPEVAAQLPSPESVEKAYYPDWAHVNTVVDKWIDQATRELGK